MSLRILDGRGSFYQWDLNQKLQVTDERVEQLHFPTAEENALVCPVYDSEGQRVVDVPNILLQTAGVLRAFAVAGDRTLFSRNFRVNPKEKPDDYIYTETEVWTVEKAVEEALQEAKANGDFKGDLASVFFTDDGNGNVTLGTKSAGMKVNLTDDGIGNVSLEVV